MAAGKVAALYSAIRGVNLHLTCCLSLGLLCGPECFCYTDPQVATAIRGAIILAKTSIVPVRRGYWGNKIGSVHTVPAKTTGKCGSVTVRLIPAPRGAGIVAARTPKKVLQMAGIEDCYTASRGSTKTLGNFVKVSICARHTPSSQCCLYPSSSGRLMSSNLETEPALDCRFGCAAHVWLVSWVASPSQRPALQMCCHGPDARCLTSEHHSRLQATFAALQNTYDFLTPDLWRETRYEKQPIQEFTDFLARPAIAEAPKAYPY